MFALDAYLPKAPVGRDYDFDRTGLRINAPDNGIAPDTGAVAVTADPIANEPSDPPSEPKIAAQAAVRQAFGKLESGPAKKPQHKRNARQPARPGESTATAQNPWFSQPSSDWSSNWAPNWSWRGPIAERPRPNGRHQVSKLPPGNQRNGNWNFNFAGAGRTNNCWGC
jgi:hypothetical protein